MKKITTPHLGIELTQKCNLDFSNYLKDISKTDHKYPQDDER